MGQESKRDIIDGQIVNWDDMNIEDMEKLRDRLRQREKEIIEKINKHLEQQEIEPEI